MDIVRDSLVCGQCLGDEHLWEDLKLDLGPDECSVCGQESDCVPVARIAEAIDPVLRENLDLGDLWPDFGGVGEARGGWVQQGEDLVFRLQEIVGCDVDLAEALVDVLEEDETYDVRDGADPFYDRFSRYVDAPDYPHEHHFIWRRFQRRAKFGRRYLDQELRQALDELLTDFPDEWVRRADGPIQWYDPGSTTIYRGRAAADVPAVQAILAAPQQELNSPPADMRSAGRLNAAGIGVFYGGLSQAVCVAEMRPSLGTYVVVGEFELVGRAKIFDLTAFDRHPPRGSLFRSGFNEERLRWRFLQAFHREISQPVIPGAEPLEYVPTQVIAEYLHAVLGFDGVVYRSAQVGLAELEDDDEPTATPPELRNVAFFGGSDVLLDPSVVDEEGSRTEMTGKELFADLLELEPGETVQRPQPLLRFRQGTAEPFRVKKIAYHYEWEYVPLASEDDPETPIF